MVDSIPLPPGPTPAGSNSHGATPDTRTQAATAGALSVPLLQTRSSELLMRLTGRIQPAPHRAIEAPSRRAPPTTAPALKVSG